MKHEHVILQFGKTLGKNGSSRALNSPLDSTMGGRGAFNLFGHIWTRHHLSLWYHPVLMHCTSHSGWLPPGEPESHHRERGCELGEEESKGGQSPEPCCCSQPSAQTRCQGWFCSAGAGRHLQQLWLAWLSWCFIMVSLECVSSPWDPPRAACWLSHLPQEGSKSSACKSCSQLCHTPARSHSSSSWHPTRGSSWNNPALPPASPAESSSSACLLHLNPGQRKDSRGSWYATGEPVSPSWGCLLSGVNTVPRSVSWYCCLLLPGCKYSLCDFQFTAYVNRGELLLVCALKAHFYPSWSQGEAQTHGLVALWFSRSKQ